MKLIALLFVLGIALGLMDDLAVASDPLGIDLGVAVGQSQVRAAPGVGDCIPALSLCPPDFPGAPFSRHTTGWKASLGIRPFSVFGAEAEYIDFGSSGTVPVSVAPGISPGVIATGSTHPLASAVVAVGYLPVAPLHLELFGKGGVAALKTDLKLSG